VSGGSGSRFLGLAEFLANEIYEMPPDHSAISRTRRLIDVETHETVFRRMLELLAEKRMLKGKTTLGIDGTNWRQTQPWVRSCGVRTVKSMRSFCGGWRWRRA
jgi:hypothetical protein